jgi:hypothetical protein
LSNSGINLWTKEYLIGSGPITATHMVATFDSGFAMIGSILDSIQTIYLVKVDANGDSLWTKYFNYLPEQHAEMIIETSDKNLLIVGEGSKITGSDLDVYAVETDSMGDSLWTKTYSRTQLHNWEFGKGLIEFSDSVYFICGTSWNLNNNSYDIILIKINQNGDSIWTKLIGDSYENTANCIQLVSDSTFIVAGTTIKDTNTTIQAYLLKVDFNGDTIWTKTYGGDAIDILYWVESTNDKGFITSGSCESSNIDLGPGFYIIKTDSAGRKITGVYTIYHAESKINFFPNPFSTSAYLIQKSSNRYTNYSVRIYDILGQMVQQYTWDPSETLLIQRQNLSIGMYLLNVIESNHIVFTQKIIIN